MTTDVQLQSAPPEQQKRGYFVQNTMLTKFEEYM